MKTEIDVYGNQLLLVGDGRQLQIVKTTKMNEFCLFLLTTEKMKQKVENRWPPFCRIFNVSVEPLLLVNKLLSKTKRHYPH